MVNNRVNKDNMVIIYLIFAESIYKGLPYTMYVGKTSTTIIKRYKQHMSMIRRCMSGAAIWSIKYKWMHNIIKNGLDLRIVALSKVPKALGYTIEKEYISYFERNSFNMLNKTNDKYYKHKIYDA